MNILGIGTLELLLIFVIILLIFNPDDLEKTGRTIGRTLRKIVTSPTWRTFQDTTKELKHLPNKLIRDAGIEEFEQEMRSISSLEIGTDLSKDIQDIKKDLDISPWTNPPQDKSEDKSSN